MDLVYLQTGISRVFLGGGGFRNTYFLVTSHSCCIFLYLLVLYSEVSYIFNSIFWSRFIHQVLQLTQFLIIIVSCLIFAK